MQPELPSRVLLQFSAERRNPDCAEVGSNFCLYFLRAAFGKDCQRTLTHKTHSIALRVLAGFMAFTLWLPLTLVGILLCISSHTHTGTYQVAQTILKPNSSLPASPSARAFDQKHVEEFKRKMSGWSKENLTKELAALSNEELIEVLSVLPQDALQSGSAAWLPLSRCLQLSMMIASRLRTQSPNAICWKAWGVLWSYWKEHSPMPTEAQAPLDQSQQIKVHLQQLLQPVVRYFRTHGPLLAQLYEELPNDSLPLVQLMTIDQLTALVNELKKSHQPREMLFLNIAYAAACDDQLTLHEKINRVIAVPKAFDTLPLSWILYFSNQELIKFVPFTYVILHTIFKEFHSDNPALIFVREALDMYVKATEKPIYVEPHAANVWKELAIAALNNPEKNFTLLINGFAHMSKSMDKEYSRYEAQIQWVGTAKRGVKQRLEEAKAAYSAATFQLQAKAFSKRTERCQNCLKKLSEREKQLHTLYNHLLNNLESAYGPNARLSHNAALDLMKEVLSLPEATTKTKSAFDAFLPFSTLLIRPNIDSMPYIYLRQLLLSLNTVEKYETALDAGLTACVRLHDGINPYIDVMLKQIGESKHVWLQNAVPTTLLQQRRAHIETLVKDALGVDFPTPLKQIILGYLIAYNGR